MPLTAEQKSFIENKVKELGDFRSVHKFYKLTDEVSNYACELAEQMYMGKEPKTKNKPNKKTANTTKRKKTVDLPDEEE